jgi:hypothetical protein
VPDRVNPSDDRAYPPLAYLSYPPLAYLSARGASLIALVGLLVLAACAEPPAPPPSEADAMALLDRIVSTATRHDFDALCAFGTSACWDFLDAAGRDAVPPLPPRVVQVLRLENTRRADGLWTGGGVLLQLCGVDGRGRPYATEMLIVRKGSASNPGPLAASEPVYWSGMRIARDATVGDGPEPIACD